VEGRAGAAASPRGRGKRERKRKDRLLKNPNGNGENKTSRDQLYTICPGNPEGGRQRSDGGGYKESGRKGSIELRMRMSGGKKRSLG